jgi:hypothetical protein
LFIAHQPSGDCCEFVCSLNSIIGLESLAVFGVANMHAAGKRFISIKRLFDAGAHGEFICSSILCNASAVQIFIVASGGENSENCISLTWHNL